MSFSSALVEEVRAKQDEFHKMTSKEDPTSEDIEVAKKFDADLKLLEAKRDSALQLEEAREDRLRAIEEKLAAEKDAQKASITRPRFTSSAPPEPDTGLKEYVPVARTFSDLLFSSKQYQQLASSVAWPADNVRIEVPMFKEVP